MIIEEEGGRMRKETGARGKSGRMTSEGGMMKAEGGRRMEPRRKEAGRE